MPKMKTHRGAAKRFRLTGSGKVKRRRGYLRHILVNKSPRQRRRLGSGTLVAKVDQERVKRMLPYG